MLIVGPVDTPYEGGFYFFQCQYPDQYPFQNMSMKSMTQGGNIRKHPNLYTCGKCCFSFLGTWSGPGWSPCQTAKSVAFTVRSVLTESPLQNEPGWENKTGLQLIQYNRVVQWFNLKYAVCEILQSIFDKNDSFAVAFAEQVKQQFILHYPQYIKSVRSFEKDNGNILVTPLWMCSVYIDVKSVESTLHKWYQRLTASTPSILMETPTATDALVEDQNIDEKTTPAPSSPVTPKLSRKSPNAKASMFEIGYRMISENDQQMYEVREYQIGGKTQKRWIRVVP